MKLALILSAGFLVAVFLTCGGIVSLAKSKPQTPEQTEKRGVEKDVFSLQRKTRDLISKMLKAPKTAKFELEARHTKGLLAIVAGTVTSQNAPA